MSRAYKFRDQSKPYFVSFATVHWIDLFTRKKYCYTIIDSLEYCQKEKDLILYAWCIMPSHLHLIIGTRENPLQNILRDFKRFTSKKLKSEIINHPQESRKKWLLWMFKQAGKKNSNNKAWQLWQQHNHPIELWNNYMIDTKLNYLHNNPVKAEIVNSAENYCWSSAIDYCDGKGKINIEPLI